MVLISVDILSALSLSSFAAYFIDPFNIRPGRDLNPGHGSSANSLYGRRKPPFGLSLFPKGLVTVPYARPLCTLLLFTQVQEACTTLPGREPRLFESVGI